MLGINEINKANNFEKEQTFQDLRRLPTNAQWKVLSNVLVAHLMFSIVSILSHRKFCVFSDTVQNNKLGNVIRIPFCDMYIEVLYICYV